MEEKYVWKIQYRTSEEGEDGNDLFEVENVISDSFDVVYQHAANKVKGMDTVKWGYTGIAVIKCVSDKLAVI